MARQIAADVIHDVGRRISEIRSGVGLTQEQMAARLEMSPKGYQLVERGKQNLTLGTMVKIANALDVRVAELLAAPASREVKRGRPAKRGGPAGG